MYTQPRISNAITALIVVLPVLCAQGQGKGIPPAPKPAAGLQAQEPTPKPSPFKRQAPAPTPKVTIPAGTEFSVRLGETLDTKNLHAGDRFSAILDTPVAVRGRTLIPAGTLFEGRVTEAQASGRLRGRGVLALALDSFSLGGATYRVQTAADVHRSGDHKKRNAALIGGGAGVGALLGKISGVGTAIGAGAGAAAGTTTALITGKKNVKLPVETPLVFSLSRNLEVRG
jgi:hypothetical protein